MQPVYRIINQQDGLPDNIVYDVKAVNNGLLYIAHQKGLCSFDGNRFVSFYNKSFPYQSVTNIMQTTDGTIWCRSFSGALFYLKNDSLYWESRVPQGKIFYPAAAFQQYIIGCTDDSIILYNSLLRSVKLKQIPEEYAVSGPATVQFSLAASLSGKTKALCSVVVDSLLNIYKFPIHQTKKWMPLFDMSSGKYAVVKNALQSNLFAPFSSLFSARSHPLLHAIAVNNVVVEDSLIWICATDGVYRLNLQRLLSQPEHFFSDYNVSYVCKDRSGNYFFSTIGSGVILVPDFNLHQLKDGVSGITCMAACKQSVYFGNRQGNVYRYDLQTNKLQQALETSVVHPVEFLFYDSIGKALISSASHFTYIQNSRERYDRFVVKDACYLDSNVLLVTNAGLYVIRNSKNFDQIRKLFKLDAVAGNIPQIFHSGFFESERVFQVAADALQNQIVLHSTSGLSVLNYASGQLDKLQSPSSLINDLTWHRGTIYLATKDKGLQVSVNGRFYEVLDREGYRIIPLILQLFSVNDELWIITENGVFIYKNNLFVPVEMMSDNIAGHIKDLIITGQKVYAGTESGIIEYARNNIANQKKIPVLIINKITNQQQVLNLGRPLEMAYDQNNVSVDFSLIEFANAGSVHVGYTINNGKPIHLAKQVRNIDLNNLAPDTYTLTLIPVLYNKLLSADSQQLVFTVNPPFWRTLWFVVIIILVLSLIVWFVMRTIVRNQQKEFAHKKSAMLLEGELNKSILSGIKSQMNPHFIFNALNTIQSYIYMNDKRSASVYISKFSDLTRNILDMSTRDSITIAEEIQSLSLYLELEKMRFEDSFNYDLQVDEQLDKELIRIPAMLVQPYVENAIKHGLLHKKTDRKLGVWFMKEGHLLKIVIDDNGIGRKRSAELKKNRNQHHQSFAMDANKKRIEILKQSYQHIQLEIVDKLNNLHEACGTQVIISLPL